ncbi:28S ribosomal protein S18c, mitochondrial [Holothuria leucospilota]|uniref:28S ribosomal protein S18c, mitochondrial n=1 Tax=Holothuria leucospilota TaxID=206669 RepID=A0A9Q0YRK0_HOLLE|nr:28S ribosomal protein S18c, mitochondrial [Holothuria leucospilota]
MRKNPPNQKCNRKEAVTGRVLATYDINMATPITRNFFFIINYSRSIVNNPKYFVTGNQGVWRYLNKSLVSSSEQSPSASEHETHQEDLLADAQDPYEEETEPCLLCKAKIPISYKNPELLSQFVSPNTGRIYDRQITKLCELQQNRIVAAIKRARVFGYMPVMYRETYFLKNPDLFDVKYTGNVDIGDHILYPGPSSSGEVPVAPTQKKTEKTKTRKTDKVKVTKTERRKNKKR